MVILNEYKTLFDLDYLKENKTRTNYTITDLYFYNKKKDIFKCVKILRYLLEDNTNFKDIINFTKTESFNLIYSLLLDKKSYQTLNLLHPLIIYNYIDYLKNNENDILENYRIVESTIKNIKFLYLINLIPETQKNINIKILDVDFKQLYLYILNEANSKYLLEIEDNNLNLLLLKTHLDVKNKYNNDVPDKIVYVPEFLNTYGCQESYIHYLKLYINKPSPIPINYDLKKSHTPIPIEYSNDFKIKFNSYIYKLITDGFYSKFLSQWYIVLNLEYYKEHNKLFLQLMAEVFNVEFNSLLMIYKIIKHKKLDFSPEVIKKLNEKYKNEFFIDSNNEETFNLSEEMFKNLTSCENYVQMNLLKISTDRLFNYEYFVALSNISPLDDGYKIEDLLGSKDYFLCPFLLGKDELNLRKIYNTLNLIQSPEDYIILGLNKYNKKEITSKEINFFSPEVLNCYFDKILDLVGLTREVFKNNKVFSYLQNIYTPIKLLENENDKTFGEKIYSYINNGNSESSKKPS
jgi:hypothetical protein